MLLKQLVRSIFVLILFAFSFRFHLSYCFHYKKIPDVIGVVKQIGDLHYVGARSLPKVVLLLCDQSGMIECQLFSNNAISFAAQRRKFENNGLILRKVKINIHNGQRSLQTISSTTIVDDQNDPDIEAILEWYRSNQK